MFSLGDAYEHFMGRWSRDLARRLVQFAGVHDNDDDVLDVGSGTGALSAAIAAAAPSSRIVGVDRSEPYILAARARHPSERVHFEVADAQHLPFADGRFDRAISLLTLNFVPDPAKALHEMIRVTRSGGTVAAAVWDYGDGMEMLRVFWDEAIALNPAAAGKDERHMPLCRRGELSTLWHAHSLKDISEEALAIETRFSSFDDCWSPFLARQGPAGAYVSTLSPHDGEQLRVRLRRRLLRDDVERPIALTARAWGVRGVVQAAARALR